MRIAMVSPPTLQCATGRTARRAARSASITGNATASNLERNPRLILSKLCPKLRGSATSVNAIVDSTSRVANQTALRSDLEIDATLLSQGEPGQHERAHCGRHCHIKEQIHQP